MTTARSTRPVKRTHWSVDENDSLARLWPAARHAAITAALPGRTIGACAAHAREFGIRRRKPEPYPVHFNSSRRKPIEVRLGERWAYEGRRRKGGIRPGNWCVVEVLPHRALFRHERTGKLMWFAACDFRHRLGWRLLTEPEGAA